jgi:hypothetical protein
VQHAQCQVFVAAVCADFGHEENLVAHTFQSLAHPVFGSPAVVFPTVIEEADAAVDGIAHQAHGNLFVFGVAQMMASETKDGDLCVVSAKEAGWNCG